MVTHTSTRGTGKRKAHFRARKEKGKKEKKRLLGEEKLPSEKRNSVVSCRRAAKKRGGCVCVLLSSLQFTLTPLLSFSNNKESAI